MRNKSITNKERENLMSIQVGDKVQWWGFKGDEQILIAGRVESVGEFNNVKTFNVRKFGQLPATTMVTASRVTKIGK